MAEIGFRTVAEMIGRTDVLDYKSAENHWKTEGLDFGRLLHRQESNNPNEPVYCDREQDHGLDKALDHRLISLAQPAIDDRKRVDIDLPIHNSNRTVGAMLSGKIAKLYGEDGLPEDTINIKLTGSAGQSLGAFLTKGTNINLVGDSNDYMGKGMSGGRIVVCPDPAAKFAPEENMIIGNVAMYGATGGEVFIRGMAGERFCVRNSGVKTVVEAVGDHACEYMTGGGAVVLGPTGRNFAAGMSGGMAFVYDKDDGFDRSFNGGMADLESVTDPEDIVMLKGLIEDHLKYTGSTPANEVLADWDAALGRFKKIMPRDYRRVLEERRRNGDGTKREMEAVGNG